MRGTIILGCQISLMRNSVKPFCSLKRDLTFFSATSHQVIIINEFFFQTARGLLILGFRVVRWFVNANKFFSHKVRLKAEVVSSGIGLKKKIDKKKSTTTTATNFVLLLQI